MKNIVVAVCLYSISLFAIANDGNNGAVTVKGFQLWSNTYNDPQIRIVVVGDTYYSPAMGGSVQTCTSIDSYMVSTTLPEKQQDRIYATLLSGVMANKAVVLILDTQTCEKGRPKVLNVMIQ